MSSRMDDRVSSETRDFIRTAYSRESNRLVANKSFAPSSTRGTRETSGPKACLELPTHFYSGKQNVTVTEEEYLSSLGYHVDKPSSKSIRTRTASTNNFRKRAQTSRMYEPYSKKNSIELPPVQTPPSHLYQLFNVEKQAKQQYTMDHYHEDAKSRAMQRNLIGKTDSILTPYTRNNTVDATETIIERNQPQYSYGNPNNFMQGDWVTVEDDNSSNMANTMNHRTEKNPHNIHTTTEYVLQFLETGPMDVESLMNPNKQPNKYKLVNDPHNTRIERMGASNLDLKKHRSDVSGKLAHLELSTLKRSFTSKAKTVIMKPEINLTSSIKNYNANRDEPLKIVSKLVTILGKNESTMEPDEDTVTNASLRSIFEDLNGLVRTKKNHQVLPVKNTPYISQTTKKLIPPPMHNQMAALHVATPAPSSVLLDELSEGVMQLTVLPNHLDTLQCNVTTTKHLDHSSHSDSSPSENLTSTSSATQYSDISCVRNVPMITPNVYVVDGGAVRSTSQFHWENQPKTRVISNLAESQQNIGWAADKRMDTRDHNRMVSSKRSQRKAQQQLDLRGDQKLQQATEYATRLQDTAALLGGNTDKSPIQQYNQIFSSRTNVRHVSRGELKRKGKKNSVSSVPDPKNLVAWIFSILRALPTFIDANTLHQVLPSQPHNVLVRKAAKINTLRTSLLKLRVQANIPTWLWQLRAFQNVLKLSAPALAVKSLEVDPSERSKVVVDISTDMLTRSNQKMAVQADKVVKPADTKSSLLRNSSRRSAVVNNNGTNKSMQQDTSNNNNTNNLSKHTKLLTLGLVPSTMVSNTVNTNNPTSVTSLHQLLVALSWFLKYAHECNPISPPQLYFYETLKSTFNTLALLPNRQKNKEHNVFKNSTTPGLKQVIQKLSAFHTSSPIHWLASLPKDAVTSILKSSVVEEYNPGEVIYTAGSLSVCFYLLVSGVALRKFGVPNCYSCRSYDDPILNDTCTCELHKETDSCIICSCSSERKRPLYVPEFAIKQMQVFTGALMATDTNKKGTHTCHNESGVTFSFQAYKDLPVQRSLTKQVDKHAVYTTNSPLYLPLLPGVTFAQEPLGRLYTCAVAEQRKSYIMGLWRILRLSIRAAALQRRKDNTNGALVYFSKNSNRYLPLFNTGVNRQKKKATVNVVAVSADSRDILHNANNTAPNDHIYFMASAQNEGLTLASLKRHIDILRQPDDNENLLGVTTTTTAQNDNHKHHEKNTCVYCHKPQKTSSSNDLNTENKQMENNASSNVEFTEFSATSGAPLLSRLDTVIAVTHCKLIKINYLNIDTSQQLLRKQNLNEASQFLRTIPLFKHLSFARQRRLQAVAMQRTYNIGEYLFKQGDPADMLMLVRLGSVQQERSVQITQVKRHPSTQDQWECTENTWLENVVVDTLKEGDIISTEMLCGVEYHDFNARAIDFPSQPETDSLQRDLTESLDDHNLACASNLIGMNYKPKTTKRVSVILIPARHIHYLCINPAQMEEQVAKSRIKAALLQQSKLAKKYPRIHKETPFPVCVWAQANQRAPKKDMVLTSSQGFVVRYDPPFTQVVPNNTVNPEVLHTDPIQLKYSLKAEKKNSNRH